MAIHFLHMPKSVTSVMSVMSVKLDFQLAFFELTYIYNKNNYYFYYIYT